MLGFGGKKEGEEQKILDYVSKRIVIEFLKQIENGYDPVKVGKHLAKEDIKTWMVGDHGKWFVNKPKKYGEILDTTIKAMLRLKKKKMSNETLRNTIEAGHYPYVDL